MWIMTKLGFFSVVEHRGTSDCLLVRARCQTDIENITAKTGNTWWQDDLADYPYRTTCYRDKWAEVLADIAKDIDYDNFKSSIKDERHLAAYRRVWQNMLYIDDRFTSSDKRSGDMQWP